MADVTLNGSGGPVSGRVVGELNIEGSPFIVVDLGVGAYVKGVYTKLVVTPASNIIGRKFENDVRFDELQSDERPTEATGDSSNSVANEDSGAVRQDQGAPTGEE